MSNLKYKHTAYTSAQWASLNPVIVENEIVIESDTKRTKIGNGISTYDELEYADANSVGNSLGSIKPTDAAPTPARNGNYTFSIGGNKPAWLTAEPLVTEVKAGDGVAVVYTAPSGYSYTHVDISGDFVNKYNIVNDFGYEESKIINQKAVSGKFDKVDLNLNSLESDMYDSVLEPKASTSVITDKIFSLSGGQQVTSGFNINIFSLDEKYIEIDLSCSAVGGSGSTMAYGFFNSTTEFTVETLISGVSFTQMIAAWTSIFAGKRLKIPFGAKSFAFVDMSNKTANWSVTAFYYNKENDKITDLKEYVEEQVTFIGNTVQTHILELADKYINAVGSVNSLSGFKTRVLNVQNLITINVKSTATLASTGNAIAFYSVTTGFSSANFISGILFSEFISNGRNTTINIPANALTMLIFDGNAYIDYFTITGYFAVNRMDNFDERIIAIEEIVNDNVVACRGDSITAATYPTNLQTLLGSKYSVQNLGVGSAWIQDIAARQGGVPFLLLNDLEIPADDITEITIPPSGVFNKYQLTGTQIAPISNLATAMLEYSPCMIDNEEFIMTLTKPGSGYSANVTIRRVSAGNAFTIKAGTPIYPKSLNAYRDVLATVFFMGTNNTQGYTVDLNTYADTIINYHKDCLKLLNNSNYLILGLFNLSQRLYTRDQASSPVTDAELLAQNVAYELKMQNEFGLHFINLRKYLSSPKSIKDAVKLGYMTQSTADANAANDATWQNKGCAAYSFMSYSSGTDYTHPNTVGYKMIAWYVFNSLKKIGI